MAMSFDLDKKEFDEAIQNKNYEWLWSAYESLIEELIIQRDLVGEVMELEKENEELRKLLTYATEHLVETDSLYPVVQGWIDKVREVLK